MSRRKIVATLGPPTANADSIKALHAAGMDVIRLNGSHATLDWHAKVIQLVREIIPNMPILLDVPGRKIRTIQLLHEPSFSIGSTVILTTDLTYDGFQKVPVNYASMHNHVQAGYTIYADDGQIRFTVIKVDGQDIVCRAECDGILRSAKGINVPMITFGNELLTDRDRQMLAFGSDIGVDFVGISFVENANHVRAVRETIGNRLPLIAAKIENRAGLNNVLSIAAIADAIMVDRGDLAVETELESVALSQKHIVAVARKAACPVIIATEMLHTMIMNSNPTKAEISDITNSVLDGASALMLSGETAVGSFAVEAVATMRRVSDHAANFDVRKNAGGGEFGIPSAVCEAVGVLCANAPISKIVAVTVSGYAARKLAALMPSQPIIAVSNSIKNARALNLLPGVTGVAVDLAFLKNSTDHIPLCLRFLWENNLINDEDLLLVVAVSYPNAGNRMNLLELHHVKDLRASLGWLPGMA